MPRHVKRSPSVTHRGLDYVSRRGLEYDLGGHLSTKGAYGTRLQKRKKRKSPKKKRKLSKLQRNK